MRHLIAILLICCSWVPLQDPQNIPPAVTPSEVAVQTQPVTFEVAITRAIERQVASGDLTRESAIRLRVAMRSSSFRHHAENLAMVQIAFSGSANAPFDENGKLDRSRVKWGELSMYADRLLPMYVQLLDMFGV